MCTQKELRWIFPLLYNHCWRFSRLQKPTVGKTKEGWTFILQSNILIPTIKDREYFSIISVQLVLFHCVKTFKT